MLQIERARLMVPRVKDLVSSEYQQSLSLWTNVLTNLHCRDRIPGPTAIAHVLIAAWARGEAHFAPDARKTRM